MSLRSLLPVFLLALAGLLEFSGITPAAERSAYATGMQISANRRPSERLVILKSDLPAAAGPEFLSLLRALRHSGPDQIAVIPESFDAVDSEILAALDAEAGKDSVSDLRLWLDPAARRYAMTGTAMIVGLQHAGEFDAAPPEQVDNLVRWELRKPLDSRPGWLPSTFRQPRSMPGVPLLDWLGGPQPPVVKPAAVHPAWLDQVAGVAMLPPETNPVTQPLVVSVEGHWLPTLPLWLAAAVGNVPLERITISDSGELLLGEQALPVDAALRAWPYFYADGVTEVSAADVRSGNADLRGKIVLVSLDDRLSIETPLGPMSLPQVIMQTAASLRAGDLYRRPAGSPAWSILAWLLVFAWLAFIVPRIDMRLAAVGTLVMLLLGLNIEFILLISQSLWVPLAGALLYLMSGHALAIAVMGWQQQLRARGRELEETRLALAVSKREQGHLEAAFETLQHCGRSRQVMRELHALGLDYERKRHVARALAVFRHLAVLSGGSPDIDKRIARLEEAEAQRLGSRNSSPLATVPTDGSAVKPRIGRFDIEKELGRGAAGVVYLGRDARIGRRVAVKTLALHEEYSGSELIDAKRRFFREAEAAGRLSHPSIVTIYDVGEEEDLAYIAMDYMRGEPLSTHTREGKLLPVEEVIDIGINVADALHYAHDEGVVHRDVKPANIVFTGEGRELKVTDFGVAHLVDASSTKTGTILGSPSFMSPEQVSGHRVDGRSDLWSLGVTLYQLLSGHLPFTGEPMATLMFRIANEEPNDIRGWRPELAADIVAVLEKALQKKPGDRFQSGREMAEALRACKQEPAA
ncbi:MAG: protein kinase [Gammaproteobacteria bacterium]|nr:protein kinase [Gammaproteobacteria bacterium]